MSRWAAVLRQATPEALTVCGAPNLPEGSLLGSGASPGEALVDAERRMAFHTPATRVRAAFTDECFNGWVRRVVRLQRLTDGSETFPARLAPVASAAERPSYAHEGALQSPRTGGPSTCFDSIAVAGESIVGFGNTPGEALLSASIRADPEHCVLFERVPGWPPVASSTSSPRGPTPQARRTS